MTFQFPCNLIFRYLSSECRCDEPRHFPFCLFNINVNRCRESNHSSPPTQRIHSICCLHLIIHLFQKTDKLIERFPLWLVTCSVLDSNLMAATRQDSSLNVKPSLWRGIKDTGGIVAFLQSDTLGRQLQFGSFVSNNQVHETMVCWRPSLS